MSSDRVWAAAAGEGSVGATRSILSKALSSAQQATVTPDTGDRGRIDAAVRVTSVTEILIASEQR